MTRWEELEHRACCATSPRWALLSAGHRQKSLVRTATTRAPRAIKKEASPRGPRPWPRLRQRPRPRPKPLTGWCALQAAIKQGDYSHLRATTSGPAPTSSCRWVSASKTASQAAADALRAGAGVGLHPTQAAHALRALLRRGGVGDARGVGAALLRQRAGWEKR